MGETKDLLFFAFFVLVCAKIMAMEQLWPILAEPRRMQILRLVWTTELAASDIAAQFEVTFGAVSQHLARLREAGLVRVRKVGRHRYYQADRDALGALAPLLEQYWTDQLFTLKTLAEAAEADR